MSSPTAATGTSSAPTLASASVSATKSDTAAVAMEENRKPLNTESRSGDIISSAGNNNDGGGSTSSDSTPGKFGSYVSYVIMIVGMVAAIICRRYASFPILGSLDSWTTDCPDGFTSSCQANQAVLRFSFAMVVIFTVQLVGALVYPKFYDSLWIPKFVVWVFIVVGFFFARPEVFDNHGYAWFGRIAGFIFLILQQLILLDFAFTWNERWIQVDDPYGDNPKPYLIGLIVASVVLFAGSIVVIGLMFWQFSGPDCASNNAILSLTIVLCVLATIFQLTVNEEYSLLTSAVMTAYATYIAYSAVVLNPNHTCNPSLSSSYQTVSEAIGIGFTVLSVTWATHTAVSEIAPAEGAAQVSYDSPDLKPILAKLSVVFILASAFFGMVLTNWSTLQASDSIANPRTGYASMWIQASAQWIALIFYCWALVAPKLFPDRDFGK